LPSLSAPQATPGKTRTAAGCAGRADLGKVRNDTIRRVLLAPLPGECKGADKRSFNTLPERNDTVFGRFCHRSDPRFESLALPHAASQPATRIALYQPDIPQNTGTILRLCACLDIEAHIIGPAGFPTSDRAFRRAGMDYLDEVAVVRHDAWQDFAAWRQQAGHRLVLFTTAATVSYLDYGYGTNDVLLFGRESAGVPPEVHAAADARLKIPMREGLRSLNVAIAAAMAAGEALRQVGLRP
jgi:tRNA (cytidine/uridine-2'-O-)-methyltransferase